METNVKRDGVVNQRTLSQRPRVGQQQDLEAEWSTKYRVKLYKEASRISADEVDPAALAALRDRWRPHR